MGNRAGKPSDIYTESIDDFRFYENNPDLGHIVVIKNKLYCYFSGEIDKADFDTQCVNCSLKDACTKVEALTKNIPNDFHAVNLHALYQTSEGDEVYNTDKFLYKNRRKISKVVGLAIPYGASSYAVSKAMKTSTQAAQACIDNFLQRLPTLKRFMDGVITKVHQSGYSFSAFGRPRNLLDKIRGSDWKMKGYAERTALNHPIQATAGDILKIGIIRKIEEESDSFLNDLNYDPSKYKKFEDIQASQMMHTVHDENLFIVQDKGFHNSLEVLFHSLQVRDVVKGLGVDFKLEADIEFSVNRDWMSSSSVCAMRFYVKEILDDKENGIGLSADSQKEGMTIIHEQADIEKIGSVGDFLTYLDTLEEGLYELKIRTKSGAFMKYDKKVKLPNKAFIPYTLK